VRWIGAYMLCRQTFVFSFVMFGTLCQKLAAQPVIFLDR